MRKYLVKIQETVTYNVEVDAETEEDAANTAEDVLTNAEEINYHFDSVQDRVTMEIARVEE